MLAFMDSERCLADWEKLGGDEGVSVELSWLSRRAMCRMEDFESGVRPVGTGDGDGALGGLDGCAVEDGIFWLMDL